MANMVYDILWQCLNNYCRGRMVSTPDSYSGSAIFVFETGEQYDDCNFL
jgi:hypothetical protein